MRAYRFGKNSNKIQLQHYLIFSLHGWFFCFRVNVSDLENFKFNINSFFFDILSHSTLLTSVIVADGSFNGISVHPPSPSNFKISVWNFLKNWKHNVKKKWTSHIKKTQSNSPSGCFFSIWGTLMYNNLSTLLTERTRKYICFVCVTIRFENFRFIIQSR